MCKSKHWPAAAVSGIHGGSQTLKKVSSILKCPKNHNFKIAAIIPKFKYAPITSVDVERS